MKINNPKSPITLDINIEGGRAVFTVSNSNSTTTHDIELSYPNSVSLMKLLESANVMNITELTSYLSNLGISAKITDTFQQWEHSFTQLIFDSDNCTISWLLAPDICVNIVLDIDTNCVLDISITGNIKEFLYMASYGLPTPTTTTTTTTTDSSPLLRVRRLPVNHTKTQFLESLINSWNAEFYEFDCSYHYSLGEKEDTELVDIEWCIGDDMYILISTNLRTFDYHCSIYMEKLDLFPILGYLSQAKSSLGL